MLVEVVLLVLLDVLVVDEFDDDVLVVDEVLVVDDVEVVDEVEVLEEVVVVVHAVFGVFTQPLAGLHESSVQILLLLQSRRPPSHSPWLLQVSMVHAFESEGHGVPTATGV